MLNVHTCLKHAANFMCIGAECFKPVEAAFPNLRFTHFTDYDEFVRRLPDADVIVAWKMTPELYAQAPRLRAAYTPAAGKDWMPPDPTGRVSCFYGSFHGGVMAEALLAMMLYFNNRFHRTLANQAAHAWDRNAQWPMRLLAGQRVLIVGYGAIGGHCARKLGPLGCAVTGIRRKIASGTDPQTGVTYAAPENLRRELAAADHVVLILPNEPGTRGMFDKNLISCMKPAAYLYNLGRGTVVNEADLASALRNGVIDGAGLDVFAEEPLAADSPLWDCPGALLLPHTSAGYAEYAGLFIEELAEKLKDFLDCRR